MIKPKIAETIWRRLGLGRPTPKSDGDTQLANRKLNLPPKKLEKVVLP